MKKTVAICGILGLVGILAWLAFGFFGIQALFIDKTVDEEIPEFIEQRQLAEDSNDAKTSGHLLGRGSFQQGDSTYTIAGQAFLSRIDGALNLTFVNFSVTNGPGLFVYTVQVDSTDNESVKQA